MIENLLKEIKKELIRILFAGSVLAKNDFKLKELLNELEKIKENTALQKLHQYISLLITIDQTEENLMNALTLCNAILIIQSTIDPNITNIENTFDGITNKIDIGPLESKYQAKQLVPLINSLTERRTGRYNVAKLILDNKYYDDYRIKINVVYCLDDSYRDISTLMFDIISRYDYKILPLLKDTLIDKSTNGNIYRIQLISKIGGEQENNYMENITDNFKSTELILESIKALAKNQSGKKVISSKYLNHKNKKVKEIVDELLKESKPFGFLTKFFKK